ncbi:hypothetical protein FUA23_15460 [Neolewinella aurantiaca]|uniref:DUF5723 domain-containing protein n=1 Tax=Neolewinella aurantiaca TaxID=2602767 RepID=A0A5C7FP58_9BACT|nr:DUF5723 family protein [Neolewinella aurantiaca]TXF88211.1 hypothetical protein FUA23_15460 [Neolewinella aurantiaca]
MKLSFRAATVLFATFLIATLRLSAQQGLGWVTDPHAGVTSAFLQPASTSASPYDWDFTLSAAGVNVRNNFTFLKNAAGLSFLRQLSGAETFTYSETEFSVAIDDQVYFYDFPAGRESVYATVSAEITGPSFSVQVGEFTRLGAFTRLRAAASTRSLDASFNYYPYDAFANGADIPVRETYASAAAWGEIVLHLSRAFAVGYDGELRLGISPKYLLGIEGASVFNPAGSSLQKLGGDSIMISNLNGELAFTNAFRQEYDNTGTTGAGFGVDLGVQYAWGAVGDSGFRYTLGLSVLDMGSITFDRGAQVHRFVNTGDVLLDGEDYDFESDNYTDEALQRLSQAVYDGGLTSLAGDEFTVNLPTAISAQFSVRPIEEVSFSAVYRGDLPFRARQLTQGSQLIAAAHYSKWWYGAGLTAGIYDWDRVNIGLQLRLGPLYLGTDELFGMILKREELSSGSFYVGLRVHDFGGSKKGRSKGRSRNNRRGGKAVKCYDF